MTNLDSIFKTRDIILPTKVCKVKAMIFPEVMSSVQLLLIRVQLFSTAWTTAGQASLSITKSQSLLKLISIASVMSSNNFIPSCPLLSCPQSFPELGSFPMSQFFTSDGQSIGKSASASVLLMNIQD